ncbi:MAG: hypothetical protein ACTHK2_05865 [Dokdonella sp.]|uniref:hypothetical protein n=1 Tax=Dokdonella sp. TaxID=2291710 RepID=UPI003F8188EA
MHAVRSDRRSIVRWLAAISLIICRAWHDASAQVPLPAPDLELVGNGRVLAMLRQADGGLIIGGDFQSINGVPRRHLARLLPDRTLDTAWDPSPDSSVTVLAQAPGGNVYVGGYFDTIGGIERPGLARLDGVAGSVDSAWVPGVSDGVVAIAVDIDGSVLLAIPFGSLSPRIAKLSGADGSPLPWSAPLERVEYLVPDGHGALYAAAREFAWDGPSSTFRATIIKLAAATGEPDDQWSFDLRGSQNSTLDALLVDGDAVYVGGSFGLRKFSASTGQGIETWNAPDAGIAEIAMDTTGHLLVGGDFESIHGQPHRHLARLSATTGLPSPGWNPSADGTVDLIRVDPMGDIDIAGAFQSVDQEQRIGLARLLASTTLSPSRNDVESPSHPFVVSRGGDGGMIVGGPFHRANGFARRNILRLNADGTLDAGWNPSLPSPPWVLAAAPDGNVYTAMNHWLGNERSSSALSRIDGSGHLDVDWSVRADGAVHALSVAPDGSVFVGGDFSVIDSLPRRAAAKIDAKSGVPLPGWDAHIDCCAVRAIESGADDHLFIGGTFQSVGSQPHAFIAKVSASNGLVDPDWNPDIAGWGVLALARDSAGALYIGGQFGGVNGMPRRHVAKLRSDGAGGTVLEWHPDFCWGNDWNYLYYAVGNLAVDGNGTVYATGYFCSIDVLERGLVRLSGDNGAIDASWDPLPWYAEPHSVTVSSSGPIYVAGYFDQAGGLPRSGLAAFSPTLPDRLFIDGFEEL